MDKEEIFFLKATLSMLRKRNLFLIVFFIEETYEYDGLSLLLPDDQSGNVFRLLLQFQTIRT